jgi:hypothetical protein
VLPALSITDVGRCYVFETETGGQGWVGCKLQATETDDDDMPHLLTDIAVTGSVETDYEALEAIQERLEKRDALPAEQLGDKGGITDAKAPNVWALGHRGAGPRTLCGLYQLDVTGMTLEGYTYVPAANEAPAHVQVQVACDD